VEVIVTASWSQSKKRHGTRSPASLRSYWCMSYQLFFRSDTIFTDEHIRLTTIVSRDKKSYGEFKPDATCECLDLVQIKLYGRVVRVVVLKVPQKRTLSAVEISRLSREERVHLPKLIQTPPGASIRWIIRR
jgi:hypothetical protein